MTVSPGARIKELRMLAGLSQEELGRRVGVQRAAINKYEKGTVANIPLHTIEQMAAIFDVSPTYIVGWNGDNDNPLSAEVKIIHGIQRFYGKDAVELLVHFNQLKPMGKKRVLQYLDDIFWTYKDPDKDN